MRYIFIILMFCFISCTVLPTRIVDELGCVIPQGNQPSVSTGFDAKIKPVFKGGISYEKIQQVMGEGTQTFEVIEYRLCRMEKDGTITKQERKKFTLKALPYKNNLSNDNGDIDRESETISSYDDEPTMQTFDEFDDYSTIGLSLSNKAIQNVMTNLGVNEKIAIAFLLYVDDFVTEVQDNFTNIASHKTPRHQKESLIEETLEYYFEDPMESEVQVPSLNSQKVRSYPVKVYLNRLSKLALKYKTVKLHFDRSYFDMTHIRAYKHQELYNINPSGSDIGEMRYEFKLNQWQSFEACLQDGKHCDRNSTKLGFHIFFIPRSSGWVINIFAITADKPVRQR